jgi:hypothetical protein
VNELTVEVDPAEVGLNADQEADLTVSFFTQLLRPALPDPPAAASAHLSGPDRLIWPTLTSPIS